MRIALIGATGMVGQKMLQVLAERRFPITEILVAASERSVGGRVAFGDKVLVLQSVAAVCEAAPTLALFSAGGELSRLWAPRFAERGTVVIDNSSAWRMHPEVPLVVPETNAHQLTGKERIIANPNCSTIQMVMVLAPLARRYGLQRVLVSTYQSVTGSGMRALRQMENERAGRSGEMAYPFPIDQNCLPHCDLFTDNGYTKEEMKLVHETRKILQRPDLPVAATAVRVPVMGGHSESVNVELAGEFELRDVRQLLGQTPGVKLQDNPELNLYPMPRYAHDKDEVFVGRVRRDLSRVNALNLWIVADNIRKGAATNAVQIAEYWQQNFS